MGRAVTLVLDTSALLFWTLAPARLTPTAADAIARSASVLVSSISLWEIALKHRQAKLSLPMEPELFAKELESTDRVEILSVDWQTWLESVRLDWTHRDPADRCIVALATQKKCPLITSDEEIQRFYRRVIW